jgi:hypothetical protein
MEKLLKNHNESADTGQGKDESVVTINLFKKFLFIKQNL